MEISFTTETASIFASSLNPAVESGKVNSGEKGKEILFQTAIAFER